MQYLKDKHIVMVDLDALLDTRLATIALFDSKIALRLSKDPAYFTREHDGFEELVNHPEFKQEDYDETYKKRNSITLAAARPTPIYFQLKVILNALVQDCLLNPDKDHVQLIVNTHPYDLERDELEDVMAAITTMVPEQASVKQVRLPIHILSPAYLKDLCGHWYTYSFDEWVETHFGRKEKLTEEEIKSFMNPSMNLYAPKRFRSKEDFDKYNEMVAAATGKDEVKDPFTEMYFLMYSFVGLEFKSIFEYSIITDTDFKVKDKKPIENAAQESVPDPSE